MISRPRLRPPFSAFGCILAAAFLATTLPAATASADLRLCNKTATQVGIAIGYKGPDRWISEGWWNIDSETCEVIVEGPLPSRYYYVYALDYSNGGEWAGTAYMCTREKEFTIEGTQDCLARGYERTGFVEIDTGDQPSWTVHLTERSKTGIGGR
jgi:uncharacterized membrane protein